MAKKRKGSPRAPGGRRGPRPGVGRRSRSIQAASHGPVAATRPDARATARPVVSGLRVSHPPLSSLLNPRFRGAVGVPPAVWTVLGTGVGPSSWARGTAPVVPGCPLPSVVRAVLGSPVRPVVLEAWHRRVFVSVPETRRLVLGTRCGRRPRTLGPPQTSTHLWRELSRVAFPGHPPSGRDVRPHKARVTLRPGSHGLQTRLLSRHRCWADPH